MCPLAGYTVAPLQGLPVQVGRVGEAHTEPHIAPGVPDLALHLAIGLGMEGQYSRTSKPTCKEKSYIRRFHSGRPDASRPTTTLALSYNQLHCLSMWIPRITRVWAGTAG